MHLMLRTARRACAHPKQFSTPYHFSGWTASPSPPQRRYPVKYIWDEPQTVEPKMYVTWIEKIALGYESRYNWLTPKPRPEFRGGFVLLHINGIAIDPAAPFA